MKHGFIGFGNLGKGIYAGLKSDKNSSFCYISKTNSHKEIKHVDKIGELIISSDIIWLCVKPKDMPEILGKLSKFRLDEKIIISSVASTTIKFVEKFLGNINTIVRIMPNLAIAHKKSITAFCVNNESAYTEKAKDILANLGTVVDLKERDFELFTAIFWSGPAFLLTIFNAFRDKISELNLSDDTVNKLLLELLLSTIFYLQKNYKKKDILDLVSNIASKGGTTEAGLKYYDDKNVCSLIKGVISTAKNRANELKKQLQKRNSKVSPKGWTIF